MDPEEDLRRKLPDHPAKRVVGIDLTVAVGQDDDAVGASDPPTQELDDVEGCLIGPLSSSTRIVGRSLRERRSRVASIAALRRPSSRGSLADGPPRPTSQKGPKGLRCQQVVTGAEKNVGAIFLLGRGVAGLLPGGGAHAGAGDQVQAQDHHQEGAAEEVDPGGQGVPGLLRLIIFRWGR